MIGFGVAAIVRPRLCCGAATAVDVIATHASITDAPANTVKRRRMKPPIDLLVDRPPPASGPLCAVAFRRSHKHPAIKRSCGGYSARTSGCGFRLDCGGSVRDRAARSRRGWRARLVAAGQALPGLGP